MSNKGSFDNLYSLKDAAKIWKIDESTLRKQILNSNFKVEIDVKKFGKQWVITSEAMERRYGYLSRNFLSNKYNIDEEKEINSFISNCVISYSIKYNKRIKSVVSIFNKFNLINYLYNSYDYLHLGSVNNVVLDLASMIRRGIRYD